MGADGRPLATPAEFHKWTPRKPEVSGVFFTLLGVALRAEVHGDAAAAGWLTLANTVGAALGAPLAGLVLLPWLGIERSVFVLALAYGLAAWALVP